MTPAEFDRLSRLLQGEPGGARRAAGYVLVDGWSVTMAAQAGRVTPGAVTRAVQRIRDIQEHGCPTCGRPITEDV